MGLQNGNRSPVAGVVEDEVPVPQAPPSCTLDQVGGQRVIDPVEGAALGLGLLPVEAVPALPGQVAGVMEAGGVRQELRIAR